jgi:diguanylate cyclase (GGDEF)-like protein
VDADILLVDDDPGAIQLMGRILSREGSLRFATSGEDALRLAKRKAPDVILLDADMPKMTGFQVCAALKHEPGLADVPIIFVTAHRDETFEVRGFDVGAADFIVKPVNPKLVVARVRAQLRTKRMADELRRNATIDALTAIANRRRFDEALESEWLRARRAGQPLALLMIDVDHFKLYNDQYGHPAGDACLRAIARALQSACMRPGDLVARYGGEEFAMLLPETPISGAEHVAQRMLDGVAALQIPHAGSETARYVTVSAGLACYEGVGNRALGNDEPRLPVKAAAKSLVETADRALYLAKREGRGRANVLDLCDGHEGELDSGSIPSLRVIPSRNRA